MMKKAERVLPHNDEAEQTVLGCLLIDNEISYQIMSELKTDDFYTEAHKIIYGAMMELFTESKPIDFVTLNDKLTRDGNLERAGGIDYITMLTNVVPSTANAKYYVDIVKRDSTLRSLISASTKIIENAFENDTEEPTLQLAEKLIFDIGQRNEKKSLEHIKLSVDDVLNKFETIAKNKGALRGITTGFYALDKITNGLQRSDLILLAARPSFGKTSLGMNILTNAALAGNKCAIFSLEMPTSQIVQRQLCSIASVDMTKPLAGEMDTEEWQAMLLASEKLKGLDIYVDDSSMTTPMDILSKCRRLKRENGLDLIMIDYLQLMSMPNAKDNRSQEISDMTRALKVAARELDIPIILLSQLNRAVEARKDHTPMLADLRESGSIEQDADIVMFINRPDKYPEYQGEKDIAEIVIAKHRNGETGRIKLKWRGELTSFVNLNKDANEASLEASAPIQAKPHENKEEASVEELDTSEVDDVF